jgi:hypothetical protein
MNTFPAKVGNYPASNISVKSMDLKPRQENKTGIRATASTDSIRNNRSEDMKKL